MIIYHNQCRNDAVTCRAGSYPGNVAVNPSIEIGPVMQQNKKKKAPSLANWLVSKLIRDRLHEEFFGDLGEIYEDRVSTKGRFYAKWMYWIDVLHLLVGFTSFNLFKTQNNPAIMYKHYLCISGRNLMRNKIYSLINVLSLAVSMGVCLAICQYIYFELSYDKFHDNYENTYRVIIDEIKNGVDQGADMFTGYAFGVNAKEEIPEIRHYVRMLKYSTGTVVTNPDNDKTFNEAGLDLFFVDNTFLEVFDFPLKIGSRESVFNGEFNIVITEKAAHKYFGSENPMGKILQISGQPSPGDYTVTGVLKQLPTNSHLQFEFLLPIDNFLDLGWGGAVKKNGGLWENFVTYVTMDESANPDLVRKKLDQFIVKYKGEMNAHGNIVEKVRLQPVKDIHLKSDSYAKGSFVTNNGSFQNIQAFSVIGFFILFISWINYINLSTARSIRRAKEVGIRKSVGAYRKQLISQFMIESGLVNFSAAILAIGIAFLTLPILSDIMGRELVLSFLQIPMFWVWFLGVVLFGSLLSGLYPAFVLSSFKPVSILGVKKTTRAGKFNLRRGLIVFQFLTSLLLIAGTYLVYKQITFMKNQELGMDIEKILVLNGPKVNFDDTDMRSIFQAFRNKVAGHHSISAVAGSVIIPGQVNSTGIDNIRKLGEPVSAGQFGRGVFAGFDFPETYGFEFVAGSWFTPDMPDEALFSVINEEAVQTFGLGSPENALQENLVIEEEGTFRIIGVVKNFHWHSLRDAHTPYIFVFDRAAFDYISFKINLSNIPESLAHIKKTYKSFFPGNPFEYFFLEDEFNRQYQADLQFGNLFFAFTVLAIFIACLGLFALVSYSATLRVKEIGIRKVFGADTGNLMILLSKEYFVLLLIATVLAIPAILYYGGSWLENYAFRIDIELDLFIIPVLVLLLSSLLTVSYRTYSTAKTKPVDSLRAE